MLSYSFPPVGRVISMRAMTFYAVALRGGGTGIRVDAQETWIVPRPPGEKVPDGVRVVEVTSARPNTPAIVSRTVTAPTKVRRFVTLLDQMPTVQPGFAYSCPAFPGTHPVVTFDFRAAAGKPTLAQASLTDYGYPSDPCNPVSFSIRGHRQKPLIGGDFLTKVQRLLRVDFR